MTKLPILFNGDFKQVVGSISFSDELLKVYSEEAHLVINPMIKKVPGTKPEVVAFCVYPAPPGGELPLPKRK